MLVDFPALFKSDLPARDKFVARLFGLFSEEVVNLWAKNPACRYENLGRPTVRRAGEKKGRTYDLALRDRETGEVAVAEVKYWPEFEGHRNLRMSDPREVERILPADFLNFAKAPKAFEVRVRSREIETDGATFVWGAFGPGIALEVAARYSFLDVLSLEEIVRDLLLWRDQGFVQALRMRRDWTAFMCQGLLGEGASMGFIYVEASVCHVDRPERADAVTFLVDSGALYSVVPAPILEHVGVEPMMEESVFLANGEKITRRRGVARFAYAGRVGLSDVLFGEAEDVPVLGVLALESLGLGLNPLSRELYEIPKHQFRNR